MESNARFQEQVKRLGELVGRFETMADSPEKAVAREILQLLMEVNGTGIERALEILFESKESGSALIDKLARDKTVAGLLLLYSLHPDALEARVEKAVNELHARLRKLSYSVELLAIEGSVVRVSLSADGHSCGSTVQEVRNIVESALYEAAPDVASLEIVEVQKATPPGFVALETLLGSSAHARPTDSSTTREADIQTSALA